MNYGQFCEMNKGNQMDICRLIHDYAEKAYIEGCNEGLRQGYFENSNEYNKGLEDAWECAKQITAMDMDECEEIFGTSRYFGTIAENLTASEAIAKIKEYEDKHTDKSCDTCKFEDRGIYEEPCKNCKHNYTDEWEAKR